MRTLAVVVALLASLAFGQAGVCKAGSLCQSAAVWSSTPAVNSMVQACYANATNAFQIHRASQWVYMSTGATCASAPTAYPLSIDTVVTPRVELGNAFTLTFTGHSNASGLPAPTNARGLARVGFTVGRHKQSDGAAWRDVGDAADAVTTGRVWLNDWSDGLPVWVLGAPHTSAFAAVVRTVTCASGTDANQTASLGGAQTPVRRLTSNVLTNSVCAEDFALGQRAPVVVRAFRAIGGLGPTSNASIRWVLGLNSANTVFRTPSTAPTTEGAWFRYLPELGDTTFLACSSGGAATTCTSTGVTASAGVVHTFEVDLTESGVVTFWVNGVHAARHTTNVPASGADLTYGNSVQTLTGAARDFNRGRFEILWR